MNHAPECVKRSPASPLTFVLNKSQRMTIIDFIIGLTLMNAMPHFVLGIYKGRMLSLFGYTPRANLLYAAFNVLVAASLFLYQYGASHLWENGILLGACFTLFMYFLTGRYFYRTFHEQYYAGK